MKMILLPNSTFINPGHVVSIDVRSHFFSSNQFYVQMVLRNGSTVGLAEKLEHQEASALRERYVAMVRDSEVDAYRSGHEDGYDEGWQKGYQHGKSEILEGIAKFRDALITEQFNSSVKTKDRRRYLRHSIAVISDLVTRLAPPSENPEWNS